MQIVPSLLFGISASLDALVVGITFGIRGARIKSWQNLLISMITLLGTCLSVGLGSTLTKFLPAEYWRLLGSLILFICGGFYITKSMMQFFQKYLLTKHLTATEASTPQATSKIHASEAHPAYTQTPKAMSVAAAMTPKAVITLGLALSANNMGIGLSASIAGLSLLPAATVTLLFSVVFLWLGNQFSLRNSLHFTENTANFISGALLVGLGALGILGMGM